MLDMLDGKRSKATETEFVQDQAAAVPARAVPLHRHPGHPLLAEPEDKTGKRNLWLRGLDRFGLGFDS